jgi:hypothetical protein
MIEDGAEVIGVERNVAVRTSALTSVAGSKFRLGWYGRITMSTRDASFLERSKSWYSNLDMSEAV